MPRPTNGRPFTLFGDYYLSADAADKLGISPYTLRNERSRSRRDSSIRHPRYFSLGTETIYDAASVDDVARLGRRK